MKKIILIFIPVIAALLTQVDDKLSQEANDYIDRIELNGESEAYLYLSGIFVAENENPIDVGSKILKEARNSQINGAYETFEYEASKKLPLPSGEAFCEMSQPGCMAFLFSSEINSETLLSENVMLVYRANEFLNFTEYKTLTKPTISERFPPYQYIVTAERIKLLAALSSYKNGDAKSAVEALLLQFSRLRKSMELQDNLIGKLVFLTKLSEILDVSSVILSHENIKVELVARLSQSEKSFRSVAEREFGISYDVFKKIGKDTAFFEENKDHSVWMSRIFFKPHMSINAITPLYTRLEYLAQLSPSDFANEIENGDVINTSTSRVRNYAGNVLIRTSQANYDDYIARFNDFDSKIVIFNYQHSSGTTLENPYYENELAKEIDESICFNGPLEDQNKLRCLRVKI